MSDNEPIIFKQDDLIDGVDYAAGAVCERYGDKYSIEAYSEARQRGCKEKISEQEVTLVLSKEQAIKLRDHLISNYPLENNQ